MTTEGNQALPIGEKILRDGAVYTIFDVQNDFIPRGNKELPVPGEEVIVVDQEMIDNLNKGKIEYVFVAGIID